MYTNHLRRCISHKKNAGSSVAFSILVVSVVSWYKYSHPPQHLGKSHPFTAKSFLLTPERKLPRNSHKRFQIHHRVQGFWRRCQVVDPSDIRSDDDRGLWKKFVRLEMEIHQKIKGVKLLETKIYPTCGREKSSMLVPWRVPAPSSLGALHGSIKTCQFTGFYICTPTGRCWHVCVYQKLGDNKKH